MLFMTLMCATLLGVWLFVTNPMENYIDEIAFTRFAIEYQKEYSSAEERERRKAIFVANQKRIAEINREGHPFTLAMNQFGDLSDEEFARYYLTENPIPESILNQTPFTLPEDYEAPEDVIDWDEKGKVTPVRDQGLCGSCWTFGSVSVVETFHAIKKGKLEHFSEQQLVDCCLTKDSHGCSGGEAEDGIGYFTKYKAMLAKDYPYTALDEKCKYEEKKGEDIGIQTGVLAFKVIEPGNTQAMQERLKEGTMYVSVNSGAIAFRFYKKGIITQGCPHETLGHGVTLIGSGEEDGIKFWRIKNSWGPNWGDRGYLKIKRELGTGIMGVCGIGRHAVFPTDKP